jgi:hypothetical protein
VYDAKLTLRTILTAPARTLRGLGPVATAALLIAICTGCATPTHADPPPSAGATLETPDAVYELWEQDWMLDADGAIHYHEKKHLRLNSDRVFRAFGNPRITYNSDTDTVEVLAARTHLPDGKYVDIEDYSTVGVAPDSSAGWPAFANVTQKVMVMGGIEPGCVLELEHKTATKAGARRYLEADLRIDNRYPVRSRKITVTVPNGTTLSPIVGGLSQDAYQYSFQQYADGRVRHEWVFADLPGQTHEPQSLPWYESGVRLAFTTAPDADTWISQRISTIDEAANESQLISKLAKDWTEEAGDGDKLAALQKKLDASFNFVHFDVDWRPATPRPAAEVIHYNYGLPAEAAAVLLSLARAAGVAAQPALLVEDDVWDDRAPQAAMVADYVIVHDGPDGQEIWHPQHGLIQRDKRWAGYTLIAARGSEIARTQLPAWEAPDQSRCAVAGKLTIADNGTYKGQLSIKTTGLFVSLDALETRDGQNNRVKRIVEHVLPGADVAGFTLKSLAPHNFEAEVEIKSSKALEKLHDCYLLELSETSPALADVSIPLAYSRREEVARLDGAFTERIDLSVEWPEGWETTAIPAGIEESRGPWGMVVQAVQPTDNGLRLTRETRVARRDLPPDDVVALRQPFNLLRTDYARTLLLSP